MDDQNSEIVQNPDALDACQPSINDSDEVALKQKIDEWLMTQYRESDLPELISAIYSSHRSKQIYGVIGVRKLLSVPNRPIQRIIDENLVPKLIEFMQNKNDYRLQLESAWALTNMTSGTTEQIQVIVNNGGLPIFVELLKSPRFNIADHAILAIGNVAGDSASFRDELLNLGALEPLLQIASEAREQETLQYCVRAISYLCRGIPLPNFDMVKPAIPTLYRILQTAIDSDMLSDSAWALAYLSNRESTLNYDLAEGVISALLGHINGPYLPLLIPSIRILGNITQDGTVQTIALDNPQYLSTLFSLTCHQNVAVRRESCWNISNITAGDAKQIEAVIDNPYYVDILIKISTSDVLQVQREILYALKNPIESISTKQLADLIDLGVLDCFIFLLDSDEPEIIGLAAHGVSKVLNKAVEMDQVGRVANEFRDIFINKKGVEKIKKLGNHPNESVKSTACTILDKHFEISIYQKELS